MPDKNKQAFEFSKALKKYAKYSKADIMGFAQKGATQEIIKDLCQNLDMHTTLKKSSVVHATFKSDKTYSFNNVIKIDWSYDTESIFGDDIYVVIFTVKYKNRCEIYKIYRDIIKVVVEGSGQLIPINKKSIITKDPSHFISKSTYCTNDMYIPDKYPQLKPMYSTHPGGAVKINHA